MVILVAKIVTIAPLAVSSPSFLVNFIYYLPTSAIGSGLGTDSFRHDQGDVRASQTLS